MQSPTIAPLQQTLKNCFSMLGKDGEPKEEIKMKEKIGSTEGKTGTSPE